MKFHQILAEASPLSQVGFPDQFIRLLYQTFNLENTDLPTSLDTRPTSEDIKNVVFLCASPSGFYALGKWKTGVRDSSRVVRACMISLRNGKEDTTITTASKALAKIPIGKYFALDRRGNYWSSSSLREPKNTEEDNNEVKATQYLQKAEDLYGHIYEQAIDSTIDFIYDNMRRFKGNKPYENQSYVSDQHKVLSIAHKLQELKEPGLNSRSNMLDYLRSLNKYSDGWGGNSFAINYGTFVHEIESKPQGLARYVKFKINKVTQQRLDVERLLFEPDDAIVKRLLIPKNNNEV